MMEVVIMLMMIMTDNYDKEWWMVDVNDNDTVRFVG